MRINDVLKKPYITEKALKDAETQVYTFEVEKKASKNQIKQAIERIFKVRVGNVHTMVRKGKIRRVGRRMIRKTLSSKKIAYIKILEGKIDIMPQS